MKVSIIVPVYNVAPYLKRCLDSVARQTFRDFEVVAVDDGSTDGSAEILDGYEADFPLMRIHQPNQGVSMARNRAFGAARGELVVFLDSDDAIHPRLLEWTVSALESSDSDFVVYDYSEIRNCELKRLLADWSADDMSPTVEPLPGTPFDWFLSTHRVPSPWQFLFRRADLPAEPFAAGIAIYEDVPFVFGFLARAGKGVRLGKSLYGYAVMERSQSHHSPLDKRMDGIVSGARLLRSCLDERQYRRYAGGKCASWIMDIWHEIRALPDGTEQRKSMAAFDAFLVRLMRDGLIRLGDFKMSRRWRVLASLIRNGVRG